MRFNLAARAGRWSSGHWKTALGAWIAFCVVAVALGSVAGTRKLKQADTAAGGSKKAERILRDAFPSHAVESVLVESRTRTLSDPAFRSTVRDVVRSVSALDGVQKVRSPLAAGNAGQISAGRRSALVQFEVKGDVDKADTRVQPILDTVAAAERRHPGFTVEEFGFASATHELNDTLNKDFQRAEYSSLPVTLLILLVAFGALVAAGLPVLIAFSGVLATIGLSALASHVVASGDDAKSVILLIGMAVGVDYSLFYIRREREERARGLGPREALLKAAGTSGHAVLISGLTVLIAMAGMLFTGNAVFTSIAVGAMLMVAVALIGSLSILPALLGKFGHRVDKGRVPVLGRRSGAGESRAWGFVLDRVMRRPVVAAIVSGGALLALATPALTLHTQLPSFTDLPRSLPIVRTYESIQRDFPGAQTPADVVVKAPDVTDPSVQQAIAELERRALATGQMFKPISTDTSPDHTVETVSISLQGDGSNAASVTALQTLRDRVIPASLGRLDGVEAAVTGETAGTHDFNQQMRSHAPLVFTFVLALCFVLLLVTFRSIVIPTKAVLLNLLSVGAAYGLMVLVFQHTWAQGILGFHSNGAITSWLPLFMFVILFGLSMDYHVFILSRIKELHDEGMPTEQAVATGIRRTAGTVTSAAVVMVAVFAIFATLRTLDIKQMGFGLAAAILIDATIVRAVLLPSVMKLLGEANWYLPRWLEWLPRFDLDHGRERPPQTLPVPEPDELAA